MAFEQRSNIAFAGGAKITGLPAGTATGEPATFEQLNAAIQGLAPKDNVRVSTQSNINLAAPGATIDGITMATNDRFVARVQTATTEIGIYIWNGAATPATRSADADTFDKMESAVFTVDEGTSAGVTYRQTAVNGVIGTNSFAFVNLTAVSAASETTSGIAELATQAETDAGSDDLRIVTPLKLATYSGRKRKTAPTAFGDGSATQFDFTHNFGMRDVLASIYRNSTPWDNIGCDISRPDTNTVRANFAQAPTINQFAIVVIG